MEGFFNPETLKCSRGVLGPPYRTKRLGLRKGKVLRSLRRFCTSPIFVMVGGHVCSSDLGSVAEY